MFGPPSLAAPCRAAPLPTSAGCRPPRARRRRASRGEGRCRAASHHDRWATSRVQSFQPAQRPGRRAAAPQLACSKAATAASQLVRLSSGSHVSPAGGPPRPGLTSTPVRRAIVHLELEQFLHLVTVLGHTVLASRVPCSSWAVVAVICACESSHIYTPQGVTLLSSATTEKPVCFRDRHQQNLIPC